MSKKEITINYHILLYAFRYCLTRVGPSHQMVRNDIFNNIDNLKDDELEQIEKEIEEAIKKKVITEEEDLKYWNSLLRTISKETKIRREIFEKYGEPKK